MAFARFYTKEQQPMNFWRIITTGSLITLCLLAAVASQSQETTGQRIGEKVDEAIGRFREGATDVAGQVRKAWEEARTKVEHLGVEGRVYARLHWDKALHDASISVEVSKDGGTTLRGTVPNAQAKVKAEQLAGDTVGVERVVNELAVQPPVRR
jgi:osmotically-inducible protein OsmY